MCNRYRCLSLVLLAAAFLSLSCAPSAFKEVYPALVDGKYDSEFPYKACSEQLEQIGETVKRVSAIAYYRRYTFSPDEKIRRDGITDAMLSQREKQSVFFNNSTSGTATTVYCKDGRVALLTCAHVVAFPDTLLSFYIDENHHMTDFVTSVSVKKRQNTFVASLPEGGEVEILALDKEDDIAVLGKHYDKLTPIAVPVFQYPFGKAKELEWGSFVYLFGYPSGYKMVTKGIVSSPNKDKKGSFLIDAVFNRGFSGGVALGVRDGVPNFELVGMVKLVSARSSYILTPEKREDNIDFDPSAPYHGDVYVEKRTEIEYGITQAISIEAIEDFLTEHDRELSAKGYPLATLLIPH